MKRLLPLFALFALVSCLAPSSPDQETPGSSSAPHAWIHFTRFDRDVALYNGFYIYYTGRDHNPGAFTCFLAGAGVKKGFSYGESDEFGFKAAIDKTSVHDFNPTLLHLVGLDHEQLTFYHNGLERKLTNVHGHVVTDVLAWERPASPGPAHPGNKQPPPAKKLSEPSLPLMYYSRAELLDGACLTPFL